MKFTVSQFDEKYTLDEQYEKYRDKISTLDPSSNDFYKKYKIRENIGTGSIEIYKLKDKMEIIIYNLKYFNDLELSYEVDEDYFEIEYCIEGSMKIIKEEEVLFREGDLSISSSKDTKGSIIYEKNKTYKGVSITTNKKNIKNYFGSSGIEVWNNTIEKLNTSKRIKYYNGISAPYDIRNSFAEIFYNNYDLEIKKLYLEVKIMEILTNIILLEKTKVSLDSYEIEKINKIPEILMENILELPTIEELSKSLGINKNKLNSGFKELYGDSIFSYHRKKSLETACIFLKTTKKTISEIALESGYSTPSNFCYAFKKQFGISPSKYRKL